MSCLLVILVSAAPLVFAQNNEFEQGELIFRDVEFFASIDQTPPADQANWQEIRLPVVYQDEVNLSPLDTHWYRLKLPQQTVTAISQGVAQVLYLWRHNMRVSVYLGDQYLGGTPANDLGLETISWNLPLLIDLPVNDINGNSLSDDYLYLKLDKGPSGVLVAPLMFGSRAEVLPYYESRYFWQVTAAMWAAALCIVLALLSLWLWNNRRKDELYWRFSAMSLSSTIALAYMFLDFNPVPLYTWIFFQHAALDFSNYFLITFTLTALSIKIPRFVKCLFWFTVFACVSRLFVSEEFLLSLAYPFHGIETLIVLGLALLTFWQALTKRQVTQIWFALAFGVMFGLLTHDYMSAIFTTGDEFITGSNLSQFSFPLLAVAFFAHLVTRFVSALDENENYAQEFDNQIEASRKEIEDSYASKWEQALKHSTEKEREKIYRDLHDDVGSKLVSIVHSGNNENSATMARSALESLREAIYRTNHREQPLDFFISSLIEESSLRIESANMTLYKNVENLPNVNLPSESGYHLSRIIRELISNTLHHAEAKSYLINIGIVDENVLQIQVKDDGKGMTALEIEGGGLANIAYRAEKIGAEISWNDVDKGCSFSLRLQL